MWRLGVSGRTTAVRNFVSDRLNPWHRPAASGLRSLSHGAPAYDRVLVRDSRIRYSMLRCTTLCNPLVRQSALSARPGILWDRSQSPFVGAIHIVHAARLLRASESSGPP